mmetsp:Transcript_9407/g.24354  ORF Transcript_9407/g.24354 Transcript_9407/m.24354 type:complete len:90 (+) Transcript_9407:763-1032(+)
MPTTSTSSHQPPNVEKLQWDPFVTTIFTSFDADKNNHLNYLEAVDALNSSDLNTSTRRVWWLPDETELFVAMDSDHSRQLSYSELTSFL